MSNRRLLVGLLVLLVAAVSNAQYRNYSLRCLAPIIENIDPNAPATLQEAFLAGPKEFAEPVQGIGSESIEFPISTESAEAQRLFEQGVALLHVLWYEEAQRAFRTVVELDPDCPMGYWGLAHANERSPQKARIFAEAARNRCDRNRPEIEQRWTTLLAEFYSSSDEDLSSRSKKRVQALENLALDFPDFSEVQAFLIRRLTLDQFIAGLPVTSTLGVDALAKEFAEKFPDHPSRHYRVFLWMDRRPTRLLDEASEMTALSPRAAEIWRYSAEAHSAAGYSDEAVLLAEAALRVDHQYLSERNRMPWQSQNLTANYEALVELLVGAGRIEEAVSWSKRALSLPRQLGGDRLRAEQLWMRARLSAGQWERFLTELENDPVLRSSKDKSDEAMRLSWKGIALLALGRMEEAARSREELEKLERDAIINGLSSFEEASIGDSRKSLEIVHRLFTEDVGDALQGPLVDLDLPLLVKARLMERSGRIGEAYTLLKSAVESTPYRWLPTAVFCSIAESAGNDREALYPINRRFRTDASQADSDLADFTILDSLAERLRLPEEWKFAPEKGSPVFQLEELGPATWEPPEAPHFTKRDRLGKEWTLEQFSGRPFLIHFFLGVQCAFCLEQFDTFQPHLSAFSEAGIDLLAISIDSEENLQKFLGTENDISASHRERFPFPVLADPELDVFRSYGVFDEFENGPMHASVLVGADGKVLWRNIAHTPFKAPESLLEEASRLIQVRRLNPSIGSTDTPTVGIPPAP